jgi:hypothetical protein
MRETIHLANLVPHVNNTSKTAICKLPRRPCPLTCFTTLFLFFSNCWNESFFLELMILCWRCKTRFCFEWNQSIPWHSWSVGTTQMKSDEHVTLDPIKPTKPNLCELRNQVMKNVEKLYSLIISWGCYQWKHFYIILQCCCSLSKN